MAKFNAAVAFWGVRSDDIPMCVVSGSDQADHGL